MRRRSNTAPDHAGGAQGGGAEGGGEGADEGGAGARAGPRGGGAEGAGGGGGEGGGGASATPTQYKYGKEGEGGSGGGREGFTLSESQLELALEVVDGKIARQERMREALGLVSRPRGPHSKPNTPANLKSLQRKKEKAFKAQEKRSEKIVQGQMSGAQEEGGIAATPHLLAEHAKIQAIDKKIFFAGLSQASDKKSHKSKSLRISKG